MGLNEIVHKWMLAVPYFGNKIKLLDQCGYLPGHYYSTIPDLAEIQKRKVEIFDKTLKSIPGIDLNEKEQFELLETFKTYYAGIPFSFEEHSKTQTRYQMKEAWYRYSDVIMLYSMIRHFSPGRIIEVGSGHSSAVMLDTNDRFMEGKLSLTFIDPFTDRLLSIMNENDKKHCTIIQSKIQDVPTDIFRSLAANDILFIDSSHVSKVGSDLNHILFNILPVLKPGVLIHFHDIYYPFEMPEHWVLTNKWFWNENYLLRAYLTDNQKYNIINFNSFLHLKYKDWFATHMPVCLIDTENTGSIWLKKLIN